MFIPFSNLVIIYLLAYEDGTDSVPKRRHIKFRRWGITQKKTYNKTGVIPHLLTRHYQLTIVHAKSTAHWTVRVILNGIPGAVAQC